MLGRLQTRFSRGLLSVKTLCQGASLGEGQKGTPGRGRDRKCYDRASLSRPLVLSLEPLTSLASSPFFCTSEDMHGRGGGWPQTKLGLEGKGSGLS